MYRLVMNFWPGVTLLSSGERLGECGSYRHHSDIRGVDFAASCSRRTGREATAVVSRLQNGRGRRVNVESRRHKILEEPAAMTMYGVPGRRSMFGMRSGSDANLMRSLR